MRDERFMTWQLGTMQPYGVTTMVIETGHCVICRLTGSEGTGGIHAGAVWLLRKEHRMYHVKLERKYVIVFKPIVYKF